ncbi:hypothetical protein SLEP1_g38120 [Rubroshorea leprosula]|uniref:Chalcone synthase n=1 Tax=Rubroshorea leprosula TaxID=152421 RepID=A0AAV5KX03_9ROSI|nr:hypothetical protein SLEP1_g38120 [Rubroshorea leprosula]
MMSASPNVLRSWPSAPPLRPTVWIRALNPDFYFRITNSEHKTELKDKFKRICEKSMINKRHLLLTEDILKKNPNICSYKAPSLDARMDIVVVEVPKMAKEAAVKAIEEWSQPKSKITHLVFCTSAGGTALRIAKDIAENNQGARVLVVCCESTILTFHGPVESYLDNLVGQALFSDGAAAAIVGSDPVPGIERPLFELVSASQTIIPNSEGAIGGPAVVDQVEAKLGLKPEKLHASRHVLAEYGNMIGACVLFILDEMRKKSAEEGLRTTGEGLDWGVLLGFGAGLTIETVVLHSVST